MLAKVALLQKGQLLDSFSILPQRGILSLSSDPNVGQLDATGWLSQLIICQQPTWVSDNGKE
jgi:hypothetical protein